MIKYYIPLFFLHKVCKSKLQIITQFFSEGVHSVAGDKRMAYLSGVLNMKNEWILFQEGFFNETIF